MLKLCIERNLITAQKVLDSLLVMYSTTNINNLKRLSPSLIRFLDYLLQKNATIEDYIYNNAPLQIIIVIQKVFDLQDLRKNIKENLAEYMPTDLNNIVVSYI